jgi:flagellar assembly factor FliW
MNGTMQEQTSISTAAVEAGLSPAAAVFEHGLLGFPESKRFSLSAWGDNDGPFLLMKCLDDTSEFLVADPDAFFPAYEPEIELETADWLGIATPEEALVLVIISVPDEAENATANLLGPLVINRATRRSMQMVLNDPWTTRHQLFAAH